jgi:hypothetical protein
MQEIYLKLQNVGGESLESGYLEEQQQKIEGCHFKSILGR